MLNTSPTVKILNLTHDQFTEAFFRRFGKGPHYSTPIYRNVMKTGKPDVKELSVFCRLPELALVLESELALLQGQRLTKVTSGNVVKLITELSDGMQIESVVLPMYKRNTLCISSQVGCRMGCRFCQTGKMGLLRNLTVEEIVGQVFAARYRLGFEIRNVVFMGMGEPLDNFDNVTQAIRVMEDQRGLDIARRYITISTAGLIKGIDRLARISGDPINLAVSLNAPTNEIRSRLMPINRSMPMEDLKQSLEKYPLSKKSSLFIEYVLIQGVNDTREDALTLGRYLHSLNTKVNLIPYNPSPGCGFSPPSAKGFERFYGWLVEQQLFVRRRTEKGGRIMAACGQLGGSIEDKNDPPTKKRQLSLGAR
jgi:23S rRNA (adenine2503-C2)-methyltransferase